MRSICGHKFHYIFQRIRLPCASESSWPEKILIWIKSIIIQWPSTKKNANKASKYPNLFSHSFYPLVERKTYGVEKWKFWEKKTVQKCWLGPLLEKPINQHIIIVCVLQSSVCIFTHYLVGFNSNFSEIFFHNF